MHSATATSITPVVFPSSLLSRTKPMKCGGAGLRRSPSVFHAFRCIGLPVYCTTVLQWIQDHTSTHIYPTGRTGRIEEDLPTMDALHRIDRQCIPLLCDGYTDVMIVSIGPKYYYYWPRSIGRQSTVYSLSYLYVCRASSMRPSPGGGDKPFRDDRLHGFSTSGTRVVIVTFSLR